MFEAKDGLAKKTMVGFLMGWMPQNRSHQTKLFQFQIALCTLSPFNCKSGSSKQCSLVQSFRPFGCESASPNIERQIQAGNTKRYQKCIRNTCKIIWARIVGTWNLYREPILGTHFIYRALISNSLSSETFFLQNRSRIVPSTSREHHPAQNTQIKTMIDVKNPKTGIERITFRKHVFLF